jgi:hypothetical protein
MKIKTALFLCFFWLILSCAKDKTPEPTDAQLVKLVFETASFRYYKDNDSLYAKTSGSGHNFPFLKTKYNTIAASQLDSEGNLLSNATFPEESFIVKELYSDSTTIDVYAVMYKNSGNANADANGWIWAYVNADKSIGFESSRKGVGCISCHSQTGNLDYMLMNKFYP